MTEIPIQDPAPVVVHGNATERLAALHAAYPDAKAKADAAAAELKAITDGIKLELTQLAPEQRRLELIGPADSGLPPLRLTYSETWRFDSTRFKKENPEAYVLYAKKSGSWALRVAKGGGDDS